MCENNDQCKGLQKGKKKIEICHQQRCVECVTNNDCGLRQTEKCNQDNKCEIACDNADECHADDQNVPGLGFHVCEDRQCSK